MIFYVILILSLILAAITVILAEIHFGWALLLFVAYEIGITVLFLLFALAVSATIKRVDPPSAEKRLQNKFYRWILVQMYSLGIHFMRVHPRVSGMDKLPPVGEPFLLVSNHLSNYDHMTILTRLRRYKLAFVSKPENFYIPIIGKYIQECAFLPIDRENARNAVKTIRSVTDAMREDGLSYGIFPEGTRSRTGELLPFHDGVFIPAKRANTPIVVVHMAGSSVVRKRGPWRSTRVYMDILGCIDAEYVRTHTTQQVSERVREMMLECEHQEKHD